MKTLLRNRIRMAIALILTTSFWGMAQFDDLYYDPDRNVGQETYTYSESNFNTSNQFDDQFYDFEDDYDFYYSSRIRRFHNVRSGFGFYDPYFVDMFYYDPFAFRPGVTIYIGNGWNRPWGWNRGWGWNAGWNNPWGWNRGWGWNDPWAWNRGWGWNDPWGWNNPWAWNRGWGWNAGWNNP
jgi:hypothetical protein